VASIRDQILGVLVAHLKTLPNWTAQLRSLRNLGAEYQRRAIVFLIGEQKQFANQVLYACTLQVRVLVSVHSEDADADIDATDDEPQGDAYRYLDRCVVELEAAVADPEIAWPDGFSELLIDGHDQADPTGDNEVEAVLRLTITYRHNVDDPSTYAPSYE
jgi:hypothetical protein